MKKEKESTPVEIFAGTQWEASIVKSLLEDAEIGAFLKDNTIGTLLPWHAAPGGANPVKVFVSGTDAEQAAMIVREFEENLKKE